MATLRIDKDTFANEREVVKEERRMRVDNQPYGRLNEIIYDQAFTVHPYKHPTIGSMAGSRGGVDRRRPRFLPDLLRARRTRRWCWSAISTRRRRSSWSSQYFGRVPKAERPVPRDIPKEPPQTEREARHAASSRGRCRRWSSRTTSPTTAIRIRIRCTSPRRCCPTARARASTRSWSTKSSWRSRRSAAPTSSRIPTCSTPSPSSSRATRRRRRSTRSIAELDRLKAEPITEHELQRTKNQFARDYILGRESNQQKALQLAHAVVIHNDIKTADGEFDIFQNITRPTCSASRAPISPPRTGWC